MSLTATISTNINIITLGIYSIIIIISIAVDIGITLGLDGGSILVTRLIGIRGRMSFGSPSWIQLDYVWFC